MEKRRTRTGVRVTGLLFIGAVILAAAATAQPNAAIEEAYDAQCYSCHWNWSPTAMKTMYRIIPIPGVEAAVGEEFEYTVQVQNAWIADMIHWEPNLDVANAPSLSFTGGEEPTNLLLDGVLERETPTQPYAEEITFDVLGNTTDLVVVVTPSQTGGLSPDISLTLVTGDGTRLEPIDRSGPGGAEQFELHDAAEIAGLGLGTWTAIVQGGDTAVLAPQVTLRADAWYNISATTKQFLVSDTDVGPGLSILFTWNLRADTVPGPEEAIRVTVNGTAYYDHVGPEEDYGNFTKHVDIPVSDSGGNVLLGTGVAVDPTALVTGGVSMARVSEAVGYATTFLLIASVWTGGMFGKASRRNLNHVFGSARRRVAFHNFVSYGLTAAALVHLVLFIIETNYEWTLGIIWGGIAFLAMAGLGVTGALQVPIIRRWNYPTWRWTHLGLAIASLAFTVIHLLLDGANFGFVQEAIGYSDPFPDKSGA